VRLREKNKQGSRERDIKITEEKGWEQHENQGKRRGRSISSGVSAVFSSTL
jgi:hypothetical protein